MEANLEASALTAIELPPMYLRAFHSLIALDSSSTFLISWFSFLGIGAGGWGLGLGAGASGFLPPTKHANRRSENEKRFKRRLRVKESDHPLVVLLRPLRLLRFSSSWCRNDSSLFSSSSSFSSCCCHKGPYTNPAVKGFETHPSFRSRSKPTCGITPLFEGFRS